MNALTDTSCCLWEKLRQESLSYEQSMDKLHRKQTGSYYTSLDLTLAMMEEMVSSFDDQTRKKLYTKNFFEPCVGTGNFVFAYLKICKNLGFSNSQNQVLLDNIYACDINKEALSIYQDNLTTIAKEWFNITLDEEYFATHIGSGLLFDVDSSVVRYIPVTEVFGFQITESMFDIVVTNPPYKNLKAERSHYQNDSQYELDKEKYANISKNATKHFTYSTAGTLNLYKLFIEEIVDRYLSPTGVCSLLISASILSDKSCEKLRTHILDTCSIHSLRIIPENNPYIDASQALCAMLFHKGRKTEQVLIDGSFSGSTQQGAYASIQDIIDEATGNALLVLSNNEYSIRKKMLAHPTIKEIPYIDNLRGELDITLNKTSITKEPTSFRLLRGRNIGYYQLTDSQDQEYVLESFVEKTAKKKYIFEDRLICQQIVNMSKKRRIAFTIAPSQCVLANSCNFISIRENQDGVDNYFLMGILNSTLIDWFFKLTSSNNHINNYEIDNFPIPISYEKKSQIVELVKSFLESSDESLLPKIDALVYEAYGIAIEDQTSESAKEDIVSCHGTIFNNPELMLDAFYQDLSYIVPGISKEECQAILDGHATIQDVSFQRKPKTTQFEQKVLRSIESKYRKIFNGEILNHTTFKLSALDLEMIRPVPQGGSWKDIPAETVKKSKRLSRITQTGGRTTLYGRIDYAKPSYTITTYFNRPGNGTYVHPIHERVLSVREAARFQCFPDDYLFVGNKSDMLKQVGNAVPVLLAYSIGKAIREKTGCCTSVDLFSGAGGMTYGFKRAGIRAVIANDFEESACITLKANSPEIPVLCGDITDDSVKKAIIDAGKQSGADIICGGPPCQGFSMAGFRMKDDPRNELFRHFVDIVSGVNPKVIVFENVEGILSFNNGETYKNIIELFSELGYHTEGRKLHANHYGVPQRRKRVIILCTRKDLGILPAEIYPAFITPNDDHQITAHDAIFDLEDVECSETAKYTSDHVSDFLKYLKGDHNIDAYFEKIKDLRGVLNSACLDYLSEDQADDTESAIQLTMF